MTQALGLRRVRRETVSRTIIGPALVLVAYCLALVVLLPAGINQRFAIALAVVAGTVAAAGSVLLWVSGRKSQAPSEPGTDTASRDRVHLADAWLILLPLTPIVQYVWLNRDFLSRTDGLLVIGACAALAGLFVLVVPFLLARFISATVTMMLGVGLIFTLFNMAALARSNAWHEVGNPLVQLGILALIVLVGVALYRRQRASTYLLAVLYFAVTIAGMVVWAEADPENTVAAAPTPSEASGPRASTLATLADTDIEHKPDIFLMTYDGYVGNETMLQYGIDNSEQEAWLESLGFDIYPETYSVAAATAATMGRVLGAVDMGGVWEAIAGKGPYIDVLRDWGYSTHGIFKGDYWFRKASPAYDSYHPEQGQDSLTMLLGIAEGEFRQDLEFDASPRPKFLKAKRRFLRSEQPDPVFLYSHSGPGHSELSGVCRQDATDWWASKLRRANKEMRDDIDVIQKNHPDAIVIVNGDHGPYLTRDCRKQIDGVDPSDITQLDIQDRFGTFLAIKWPDDLAQDPPDIEILQDVLPSVFGFLEPGLDDDALRLEPRLDEAQTRFISGVTVDAGRIVGGDLDGSPLFEAE